MATGTIKAPGWQLLWTNPNPGASFAAQTVSLDLSGYKAIAVVAKVEVAYSALIPTTIMKVGDDTYLFYVSSFSDLTRRRTAVNTSGVIFRNGERSTGGNFSSNNGILIPYYIYGIA